MIQGYDDAYWKDDSRNQTYVSLEAFPDLDQTTQPTFIIGNEHITHLEVIKDWNDNQHPFQSGIFCNNSLSISVDLEALQDEFHDVDFGETLGFDFKIMQDFYRYKDFGFWFIYDYIINEDTNIATINCYTLDKRLIDSKSLSRLSTDKTDIFELLEEIEQKFDIYFENKEVLFPFTLPENYISLCNNVKELVGYIAGFGGYSVRQRGNAIEPESQPPYRSIAYQFITEPLLDDEHAYEIPSNLIYMDSFKKNNELIIQYIRVYNDNYDDIIKTAIYQPGDYGVDIYNPFYDGNTDRLYNIYRGIFNKNYISCTFEWVGNPAIQEIDTVEAFYKDGNSYIVPVMRNVMTFDGGFKQRIESYGENKIGDESIINNIVQQQVGGILGNLEKNVESIQDDITTIQTRIDDLNGGDIAYDNTTSGLQATNVQGAIDEVVQKIKNIGDMQVKYSSPTLTTSGTFQVTDTINVDRGVYIASGSISFAGNSTGRRVITLTADSESLQASVNRAVVIGNQGSAVTIGERTRIFVFDTDGHQIKLGGCQYSGGSLSCSTYLQVVKIA